jgi:hypothetical protein
MGFNIHILSGRNRSTNLARHAAQAASFNPGAIQIRDRLRYGRVALGREPPRTRSRIPSDSLRLGKPAQPLADPLSGAATTATPHAQLRGGPIQREPASAGIVT